MYMYVFWKDFIILHFTLYTCIDCDILNSVTTVSELKSLIDDLNSLPCVLQHTEAVKVGTVHCTCQFVASL